MGKKILLVDDELLLRMDIKDILESYGYEIIGEVSDGFEVVEMCKKYKFDLVIMDIEMLIFDGIKVGKIICKENLVGGVFLLILFEDKEYVEKVKSIGVYGYLVKIVSEKLFILIIEMCLNKVNEFEKMKKDLEKVNFKLNERKLVERVKGIFIREFKIFEDEVYIRIRKLSMDKRIIMMEIVKMIIIGYDD